MILGMFGVIDLSPIQVSDMLKRLKMSHTIEGGVRHISYTIDGLCKEQPVWPVVIDRVKAIPKVRIQKDRMVYFVCDSRASLASTNGSQFLWPVASPHSMMLRVQDALQMAHKVGLMNPIGWELHTSEPSISDYVNAASKPSFLNHIQTAVYKINPYALRKEVQALIILFLSGKIPASKLRAKLKSSFKFDDLTRLMNDPNVPKIREACELHLKRGLSIEAVEKQTGVATFELLYLVNSARKLSA